MPAAAPPMATGSPSGRWARWFAAAPACWRTTTRRRPATSCGQRRAACPGRRRAALDRGSADLPCWASRRTSRSDQLFAAWRTFFERHGGDRTGGDGLRGPAPRRHRDARLHRPPHGVEPGRPASRSSPWLARSCSSSVPTGEPASAVRLDPPGAAAAGRDARLLEGLVPGLPTGRRGRHRRAGRGHPALRGRDGAHAPAQGQLVLRRMAHIGRRATLDEIAVPESLTALISARLDALEPADRGLIEDAAVLGQSFTVAGAVRGLRGRVRRSWMRACAASSGASCWSLEADPALAGARPVLVRPVADPGGRLQHALEEGSQGHGTWPPRAISNPWGPMSWPAAWPGTTSLPSGLPPTQAEADALAAQARIALRGAAERAAALGSHEQALTFLDQALQVAVDAADRLDLHRRAQASAEYGLDPQRSSGMRGPAGRCPRAGGSAGRSPRPWPTMPASWRSG